MDNGEECLDLDSRFNGNMTTGEKLLKYLLGFRSFCVCEIEAEDFNYPPGYDHDKWILVINYYDDLKGLRED